MIHKLFTAFVCLGTIAAAQEYVEPAACMPPIPPTSRFTMDFSAYYGFNAAPDSRYAADMFGMDIGGAFYITPRQAVTLSLLAAADTSDDFFDDHHHPAGTVYDRSDLSLMAGYRFTQPIGPFFSLTLGARCGLDCQRLSVRSCYYDHPHCRADDYRAAGTRCGFGYAGYAEIGIRVTPKARLTAGYQYHGATTKPVAEDDFLGERYSAKDMRWHEVRLGLDICF